MMKDVKFKHVDRECDVPSCHEPSLFSWVMADGPSKEYRICRECLTKYFRDDRTLAVLKRILTMKNEMRQRCREVVVDRVRKAAARAIEAKMEGMGLIERTIYREFRAMRHWEETLWDS